LNTHRAAFARRSSSIYRNKPEYSIFGVGPYTFSPWKVAISGLYKSLTFCLYGPREGKPVIFDDTVYFLPFQSRGEAETVLELLNHDAARSFLQSMIFWDEKRPVTAELLRRLDIVKLAKALGCSKAIGDHSVGRTRQGHVQPLLI
jgi:hypothetical protein